MVSKNYGTFKYGDGTHYGASTYTGPRLTWIFLVDWNNDDVMDGTNEAIYIRNNLRLTRGRHDYLDSQGNGFEDMQTDTLSLTLNNRTKRFDPRNGSSPLSPNVYPGKKCYLGVKDRTTGTTHNLFSGFVDSIVPSSDGMDDVVDITCFGWLQFLNDKALTARTARTNTTIHDAFISLLDDAEYPQPIEIDDDAQPVTNFEINGEKAGAIANDLAHSACGTFFVDKNGHAKFYARSRTSFTNHAINENNCLKTISISQPWEGYYSDTTVITRRQIKEQPCVVWSLPNPEPIEDGVDKYLYPKYQGSTDIVLSEYAANTAKDDSGSDITSSVTLDNALSYLGPSGGTLAFAIDATGYITQLEIRGRRWKESEEQHDIDDATVKYRKRFTLDVPFLQDRNYGQSFAGTLASFLKDDRESLIIQIMNNPALQFPIDLLDKVTFTGTTLGLSSEIYYVFGIDHECTGIGQVVVTTLYLHKMFLDETTIAASPVEELPVPPGLNDPGGDTGDGGETGLASIPIYHNDVLVGDATELNFLDSNHTT